MSPGRYRQRCHRARPGTDHQEYPRRQKRHGGHGGAGQPGKIYHGGRGENEEDSPWEPLHVEHGFNKEDNAITLVFSRSFVTLQPYGTDDKGILATLIYNIWPEGDGTFQIMMPPTLAQALGNAGWNKKNIQDFILENARVPWFRHPRYWSSSGSPSQKTPPLNPNDSAAILRRTERAVLIFVAGGTGSRMGLFGGSAREPVTKKVDLPANWNALVQKYKNVVPSYLRY